MQKSQIPKEKRLHGRYITLQHIEPLLNEIRFGAVRSIGKSVEGKPLYSVTAGTGEIRLLLWSQMHGNESTATKALFDLFAILSTGDSYARMLLEKFTFCFIPILNPDGAEKYTRENAVGIDLNRDFMQFSQPESAALDSVFRDFRPNYCFNLHDQRTIFGVGDSGKPATISFLAPAYNDSLEWNPQRKEAARIINVMNASLQKEIPGQVGRFDDAFNINCAGDKFQWEGVSTILIEAGHFSGDYDREMSRAYFLQSLIAAFEADYENDIVNDPIVEYLNIPQNKIVFYDFVYKNIRINYDGNEIITNFASQYKEMLADGRINFNAEIVAIGNLDNAYGHCEFDANGASFLNDSDNCPVIGQPADFYLGNTKFTNGAPDVSRR